MTKYQDFLIACKKGNDILVSQILESVESQNTKDLIIGSTDEIGAFHQAFTHNLYRICHSILYHSSKTLRIQLLFHRNFSRFKDACEKNWVNMTEVFLKFIEPGVQFNMVYSINNPTSPILYDNCSIRVLYLFYRYNREIYHFMNIDNSSKVVDFVINADYFMKLKPYSMLDIPGFFEKMCKKKASLRKTIRELEKYEVCLETLCPYKTVSIEGFIQIVKCSKLISKNELFQSINTNSKSSIPNEIIEHIYRYVTDSDAITYRSVIEAKQAGRRRDNDLCCNIL